MTETNTNVVEKLVRISARPETCGGMPLLVDAADERQIA
jgi:hypothetical protein